MLQQKVKQLSHQFLKETIANRRHIHANPELSFQEFETSKFIQKKLSDYQIPFKKGFVKTGIVAKVEGKNPKKKTIALRADIDALPIVEENKCKYRSKNKGVMHACGHDAHTASLLSCGRILNSLKNEFEGTVKLIFQPAEERFPGGAKLMIEEGVLEKPKVEQITGQHVYPDMPTGQVGFISGACMASADEIYITVKGKGGHAAMPEKVIDPVMIAAQMLTGLQQVVARRANPTKPSVLSFGKIVGMGATNIIPDEVVLDGTFRTFDETWRKQAHKLIKNIVLSTAKSMGGKAEIDIKVGYPALFNNESLTAANKTAAQQYLGKSKVKEIPIRLGAEDFAYYSQKVPACFYRLGTANKGKNITSGLHTTTFDIDESALEIGSGLMAYLALSQLQVA